VIVVEDTYDDVALGPGFRTRVKVDTHAGETTSLAEVLASAVGVHVRALGGLGGFSSVSIRGASPSHTAVFVDGIPLSRLAFAAEDLSVFELSSVSDLEVYRGAVPVELGGAALGGAINLRTQLGADANGDIARLSAGFGSFGARHLRARLKDDALGGKLEYHLAAGYRATTGDYRYFNDNGTPLISDDDGMQTRRNNGFDQFHALARARYRWREVAVEAGSRTTYKNQQLPGLGTVQATAAHLRTLGVINDATLRYQPAGGRMSAMANTYVIVERHRYDDPLGEIGVGVQSSRYQTVSTGGSATLRRRLGEANIASLSADGRVDRYTERELMSADPVGPRGWRWSTGLAASDDVALGSRVHVTPALRFDHQYTDPGDGWNPVIVEPDQRGPRSEQFFSPRVAARALLGGGVIAKASAGRYFRAPTLTELFGDRGFIVGNPALRAEEGTVGDVGLVFAPTGSFGPVTRVYAQLAGFVAKPEAAIALVPTAGGAAVATNLGDATIRGIEAAATVSWRRRLLFTANYTFVDSRQHSPLVSYDGKRLPLRPRHEAYARIDAHVWPGRRKVTLWGDVSFTSGNFLDAANNSQVPRRLLVGAGVKTRLSRHWLLGVEVKNVTNTRVESVTLDPPPRPDLASVPRAVSDFLGYPLPGRAFYASLDATF